MTMFRIRPSVRRPLPVLQVSAFACATLLAFAVHDAAGADAANGGATRPSTERADVREKAEPPASTPPVGRSVDVSAPVIRKAIADSKEVMDDIVPVAPTAFGNRPISPQQRIDRSFEDADIPSCLTPDAYKFVPPRIGPFEVSGLLALPFWAEAITTGKCRH